MSAKDNFAQAMKELLNAGDGDGATEVEESKAPSSFSSFSMPDTRPPKAPAPEKKDSIFAGGALPGDEAENETAADSALLDAMEEAADQGEIVAEVQAGAEIAAEEATAIAAPAFAAAPAPAATYAPAPAAAPYTPPAATSAPYEEPPAAAVSAGSVTVIAAGTTIVGDINTAGGLTINGDVKGDIKVATKLILNGKIIGDVEAENAEITGSMVRGNIKVTETFAMDGATTVVGDISARNAKSNGKIKGNLTVMERGHFESSATLVGNLIAGTVIIDEGAMLKGDIAITNAQNENIAVDEPEFDIQI